MSGPIDAAVARATKTRNSAKRLRIAKLLLPPYLPSGNRQRRARGVARVNAKRVYRIMAEECLLLLRYPFDSPASSCRLSLEIGIGLCI